MAVCATCDSLMERRASRPSIHEVAGQWRPALHEQNHGGNDQDAGGGTECAKTLGFGVGAIGRAAISIALDCIGDFLHRHMDAECGRWLADDANDNES